ncbi:MAG: alpha/beta fold hydrolase [Proteobacteria bacterium]|nr:alpha/beta fold hydrolase [Pseudomonadota bacterium]
MLSYWRDLGSRYSRWSENLLSAATEPVWTTPNDVALRTELGLLRRFGCDRGGSAPWLVVNPNAGHHSVIGDYAPGQSLVEALLKHGGGAPVFAVEWLSADAATRDAGIDEYLLALDRMVGHARRAAGTRRVRLVGLCQGGWLSAMLTAILPDAVENLILAGAPIDFRAGQGKVSRAVENLGFPWYEGLVRGASGVMPGRHMVAGWKLLNPLERFFGDPLNLWAHIDEEQFVERHQRFRNWYEWTQDLPGRFYLEVVRQLFDQNLLVRKRFRAFGEVVDLARIHCPVSTVGGLADDITLQEQLEAIEDHVSSLVVRKRMVSAGHIGLFMQRRVIQEVWPEVIREALADAQEHCQRVKTFSAWGSATLEERGLVSGCRTKASRDGLLLGAGEGEPHDGVAEWASGEESVPLLLAVERPFCGLRSSPSSGREPEEAVG